ncbi:TIGR01621 family pseudouridine synthase [Simiduia agarivorans]|uniref:Pseudouridine synthase Rlu family protein n=1 Tax=Simiduia agarivorans (strain DSM 21679 / JCM 13881 / BCRC 17597 / SA1) TaxID=1117647 RepID=K4KUD5_SIMAS|nr:TIGR01621 family pseudouridine synthase [Simiduia agarivorans]AFU97577.2 pseudouridine synthase Rlu family protein [Simiduia agarivorans SA1 = DSM 21679]
MAQVSASFSLLTTDPDFFLIHKAPGVNFHTEGDVPGVVTQAEAFLGESLWPVHRLDKMTSGLLLLARSASAAGEFGRLFEQRAMEKYYLAIGRGKPNKKQGLIAGDMSKARRRGWKLLHAKANPALTQFFSAACGEGHRLFVLKPHTGKTHQLRVALNSLGCPVAGDDIYDAAHASAYDRGYLHAWQLQFTWRGQPRLFTCAPCAGERFAGPAFEQALAGFASPETLPWPALKYSGVSL